MKCDKCNRIPCRCPKEQCCNHFAEYGKCVPAGIRNVQPSCKDLAVIPSVTVEQTEGMKNLANCFVHVTQNNTTYYIDDKHRVTIIWAGPVEENNYNIALNLANFAHRYCTTTLTTLQFTTTLLADIVP